MPLFGRETRAEAQRIERIGEWTRRRSPLSLASMMFGIIAVVDAWTMVIGLASGLAAIVLGFRGLSDLARQPELLGHRLCRTGIILGTLGIALSGVVWFALR